MSFVTAPPPQLRESMVAGEHRSVQNRNLADDQELRGLKEVREYDKAAKRFDELSRGKGFSSRFYEAYEFSA